MFYRIASAGLKFWWRSRAGVAATEFAIAFPMLFMMLLGTVELGQGIIANHKAIMASQVVTDLVTRTEEITDDQLDEAKRAGRLALSPYDTDSVGIDIISIRFDPDSDDEGDEPDPVVVWRETDNMDDQELDEEIILENVLPLALVHDGLVAVYVRYPYRAAFGSRFVGDLNMVEASFGRGRKSPVVTRAEGP